MVSPTTLSVCGGAVDGSNQLGAIVTCQAMTARPAQRQALLTNCRTQARTRSLLEPALSGRAIPWHTNRNISAKEPERYLAERRDGTDLGENEIRARLATHLIPYDEMVSGDYQAFLAKRASLIHEAMIKLCATGGTQAAAQ